MLFTLHPERLIPSSNSSLRDPQRPVKSRSASVCLERYLPMRRAGSFSGNIFEEAAGEQKPLAKPFLSAHHGIRLARSSGPLLRLPSLDLNSAIFRPAKAHTA